MQPAYLQRLAQGHMQEPLEAGHHAHALAPDLVQHAPDLRIAWAETAYMCAPGLAA